MFGYDRSNLKGDLSGGLVAGVIALPLALAFGVQSGLGAAAGLYGAIALGILAAALGGTATQASGPTGPMTVVAASVVAVGAQQAGGPEAALGFILLTFLACGVLQLGLGLLGVGRYVKYFPYPVISGFMSGVGLIIIALQIWPFLGSPSPKTTLDVVLRIAEPIAAINPSAVLVGALTVATYYLFPLITKKVPAVLVALVVGTLAALPLDVPVIGAIPSGLPDLRVGDMLGVSADLYPSVLSYGFTLALLGSIDSLLTSVIADNITKTRHDSRRELIGQGIGNAVAALIGGLPGAGATKGTVVNISAGGTTRLSGVIHGLVLLTVLLGLGRFAAYVPLSVLAGLLIPVGLAIIDTRGLRHLRHVPKSDAAVLAIVLGMTVFGNLIHAVGLGIVLASVLFMKKLGDLAEVNSSIRPFDDVAAEPGNDLFADGAVPGGAYVKTLHGPLFFGSSAGFQELVSSLAPDARVLVMRMDEVSYIDQSGLYAMENAMLELRQAGVTVAMCAVREQPLGMFRSIQLVPDLISEDRVFADEAACSAWLRTRAADATPAVVATP